MAIEFRCIRCGQLLRVARENQGQRARCPTCNAVVDIPGVEEPASPIVMAGPKSDVIDYELFGNESQYVEITLDPGEVAAARLENMLFMASGIAMESLQPGGQESNRGLLEKLSLVGRRIFSDSSVVMTAFCNVAEHREAVAFAPAYPCRLVPLLLAEYAKQIFCQSSAILCLARGIEMHDCNDLSVSSILPMQRITGDGLAVLQAPGALSHHLIKKGQHVNVRTHTIVAFTSQVTLSQHDTMGVAEFVPVTTVRGPGEIWLSSTKFG